MKAHFTAAAVPSFKVGSPTRITKNARRKSRVRTNILTLVGIMIIAAAALAVPSYSVHSSSVLKAGSKGSSTPTFLSSRSPNLRLFTPLLQATPQPLETFAADCTTPKTSFVLGDTVCAVATGLIGYRFSWVDSAGFIRQRVAITSDPQTDTFVLPATQTSLINDTVVDNRGEWRVNAITSRGSLKSSAFFTVTDPAHKAVDLSITKTLIGDPPVGGGPAQFVVSITNNGPDDAANAHFVDNTFTGATFNSLTQTDGPAFTCANDGVDCTLAVFPNGAQAKFLLSFTAGAAGSSLQNTATISSNTEERNTADNSFTTAAVKVASGTPPPTCTLDCPENIIVNADTEENGQRGAHVIYDAPQASENCGIVTSSPASGSFFPVGNNTVTATSSEGGGSCSFTITVLEQGNAPTISCPPDKVVDAQGDCSAQVTVGTATATGGENVTIFATRSDGKPMYDCDANGNNCVRRSPDAPFAAGVTTITWTATSHNAAGDATGTSSCTQTITVNNASEDTTAPVITCPGNITRSNDAGQCNAVINVGTATATDNCDSNPVVTGTRSDNEPLDAPYPKGTTTITWTATDASGNSSSCAQTVTVNDTENPTISCPGNITRSNDPGVCGAVVTYTAPVGSDNCPGATTAQTAGLPSGSTFPVGTTTNTFEVTDSSGNKTSCSFTVTVNDTESPTISCPSNITKNNDPGTCGAVVTYTTPVGSDNCPGATTTQTAGLPSGSTFPVGTTTNTFEVTDASGNKTSCSFTVTVNDAENPVISCPASITLEATCPTGAIATYTAPVGTDNCPGATTSRTAGLASGSVFPIGSTTVTYTVNDAHGHSASCSFTVTVLTPQAVLQNLRNSVNNSSLNGTQKNGLLAKIDAALTAINGGGGNACAKLSDFVNSVGILISNGSLSASTGNAWINSANNVRNTIGCTNNPCS